ncbi:hypothetical protein COO60DRAFT_1174851 [Scenedesmus sp. NREL 46B-D3]|nr:hypothetical protein COO60DRAFT_1174851 [Scenedesmus sp. NREL 46B-D3]
MMNLLQAATPIVLIYCLKSHIGQHFHGTLEHPMLYFQREGTAAPLAAYNSVCCESKQRHSQHVGRTHGPITTRATPCLAWLPSVTQTTAAPPATLALTRRSDYAVYYSIKARPQTGSARASKCLMNTTDWGRILQQSGDHNQSRNVLQVHCASQRALWQQCSKALATTAAPSAPLPHTCTRPLDPISTLPSSPAVSTREREEEGVIGHHHPCVVLSVDCYTTCINSSRLLHSSSNNRRIHFAVARHEPASKNLTCDASSTPVSLSYYMSKLATETRTARQAPLASRGEVP